MVYIMVSIPISGGQTSNELRLQPLNPTQHWSPWRSWGCPTPTWSPSSSTYLDLPRDLVLRRLSHLNLLRNPPVQGSQEVKMPQPALGPNSQEADMQPAQGFNLQEAITPQPAWGSAS